MRDSRVLALGVRTTKPELRRWLVLGPSLSGITGSLSFSFRDCLDIAQFAGILVLQLHPRRWGSGLTSPRDNELF